MQWLRRVGASGGPARPGESSPSGPGASTTAWSVLLWPAIGFLIWGLACLFPLDGDGVLWWAGRAVLLAALVWIPLTLRLVEGAAVSLLPLWIPQLQPWCAVLLLGSFLVRAGTVAMLLAVPWALWTALLGLRGLLRLRERPLRDAFMAVDELCLSLGMVALPVGGLWLVAARGDLPVLGFVAPFTLLTGMHFHYAGLLMPTVIGLSGRLLGPCGSSSSTETPSRTATETDEGHDSRPSSNGWRIYRVLAPAASLGPWLVAIGITVGGLAEAVFGTIFATLLACLGAVLLLRVPPRLHDRSARLLLTVALLATWPAMALAALYALSRIGRASVGLETMALLHGPLLAIVFVGGGLLALARVRPAVRSGRSGPVVPTGNSDPIERADASAPAGQPDR